LAHECNARGEHPEAFLRRHRPAEERMAYYRLDDAHVRMQLDLGLTHTQHTDAIHPERAEHPR